MILVINGSMIFLLICNEKKLPTEGVCPSVVLLGGEIWTLAILLRQRD